jgi:hypothetical protein
VTPKRTFTTTRRIVIEQECTFHLDLPTYVSLSTAAAIANDYLRANAEALRWTTTQQLDPDSDYLLGLDPPTLITESLPLPPEDIIPNGVRPQRKGASE